jgi:tetratricopeptide (TPR) repeat protein
MEVAPVEVAPVEVAPVEVAPVEVAPVEVAPAEVAPVEVAPAEVAPAETADVLDLGDLDDFTDLTVGDLVASVEAPRSGEDAVWEALLSADPIASPPEAGEGSELEAIEGLLVSGAVDEALAAAQAQEGLGAAILVSRAYAAKGEAKKGLSSLRDAVDEAPEFDPYFVQALFALAELYIANNKLRSALRRLEDIVEADPEWRSRDVRLRIQALKQRLST